MERFLTIYSGPTIILLIIWSLIFYDKIVSRHKSSDKNRSAGNEAVLKECTQSPKQILQQHLHSLNEAATFSEIDVLLRHSWTATVSQSVYDTAAEVFSSRTETEYWMTTPCKDLGGEIPADLSSQPNGDDQILAVLKELKQETRPF
jgi:hypothetical protein